MANRYERARTPTGSASPRPAGVEDAEPALSLANAQLLEADGRKNEFLAVLSHELRNPLAPIKNSLFILEHVDPHSDRARRAQEVIHRQVTQLSRLVDDLLEVTRIASNKIELRCEHLELNELVHKVAEDQRSLFERKEVRLEVRLLEQPRRFRPEVVFCDIGLPGIDGYEVARAFRSDAILCGAYLVALSGYALPEDVQRAEESEFDRHLAKPPKLEALEGLLAAVP